MRRPPLSEEARAPTSVLRTGVAVSRLGGLSEGRRLSCAGGQPRSRSGKGGEEATQLQMEGAARECWGPRAHTQLLQAQQEGRAVVSGEGGRGGGGEGGAVSQCAG